MLGDLQGVSGQRDRRVGGPQRSFGQRDRHVRGPPMDFGRGAAMLADRYWILGSGTVDSVEPKS